MEWKMGVKDNDLGKRCKQSETKGRIIEIYDNERCLMRNDNGTEHVASRSNLLVEKNQAAASLGKLGGKSKSAAKKAASRENGKKGGRPKGGKNKT